MDEDTVCDDVLKPVFGELGWKVSNKRLFRGQYKVKRHNQTKDDRADYALFTDPESKHPSLILEAKRPNRRFIDEAEVQANEYARVLNVDMAVATDGRIWRLYLVKKGPDPKDCLALEFSLEKDLEYVAKLLPTVLGRGAVASRDAVRELEKHYKQTQAERRFPEVWSELLDELPTLLIGKVKGLAGIEPSYKAASAFVEKMLAGEQTPPPRNGGDKDRKLVIEGTLRLPGGVKLMPKKGILYLPDGRAFPYDKRADAIVRLVDCAHGIDRDSLGKVGVSHVKREQTERCKYRVGKYWVSKNISDREAPAFLQKLAKALGKDIGYLAAKGERVTIAGTEPRAHDVEKVIEEQLPPNDKLIDPSNGKRKRKRRKDSVIVTLTLDGKKKIERYTRAAAIEWLVYWALRTNPDFLSKLAQTTFASKIEPPPKSDGKWDSQWLKERIGGYWLKAHIGEAPMRSFINTYNRITGEGVVCSQRKDG